MKICDFVQIFADKFGQTKYLYEQEIEWMHTDDYSIECELTTSSFAVFRFRC